jgi:putative heme-binding domain-containing protein
VRPSQGTFGIHAAQIIAPGDPFRSALLYRMSKLGGGRMPHIGSSEVDREGVELIYNWIRNMSPSTGKEITANEVGSSRIASELRTLESAQLENLRAAKSPSRQSEIVASLLASTTGAMQLLRSMDRGELPATATSTTIEQATRHQSVTVRDLFERFLAADDRIKRLGSVVRPEQILEMTGDAARGRAVFFQTAGVSCSNCHRIHKDGKDVGPELTTIGKKLTRAQLLESMLEPSKRIDPKFVTYIAETTDGRVFSGVLVNKNEHEVVLKDAEGKLKRISTNKIEQLATQAKSLMPDLLLRDMTAQQVADLLAYLSSLK